LGSKSIAGALLTPSLVGFLEGCSKTELLSAYDWQILSNQLNGAVLLPGAPGFDPFTIPYALQYGKTIPQAVVRCMSEKDVVTTVKWARQNGIAITTRSGGHSYAGYSSTNELLLDVSGMTNITLNSSTGLATLDGGVRNKHVYAALREPSIAITHGRCKAVGVGGLVLGGGIGFNMRAQGLTCDQLVETRMVTADGDIVVCNEKENKDLFWAIRGAGGGNFGIHTSFTFKPFAVTQVTRFRVEWSNKPQQVYSKLQEVLLSAPNELGIQVSIELDQITTNNGEIQLKPYVSIIGQLKGDITAFESIIAPVNSIANPTFKDIQIQGYWDAQEILSEEGSPEYVHERCRFAFEPLSDIAISAIFMKLIEWPRTSGHAIFKYFLLGGAVAEKGPEETAFFARKAKMITSIELSWKEGDQNLNNNIQWHDEFHMMMEVFTSKYSYINFIDRKQPNFLDAYYGPSLPKLKEVKKLIDPKNHFRFPQSIPVG
ncbi:MAG: FAD-binding oxidoreductase, partial [Chitinophagaceae bacterium]|nr:FAD-binding oxidoreductase [Chitinophagaceae bacterium]